MTLPGTTPAIPGRPRAARRIPTLPRPCAPGRTSRKTPPGGRTGAPTLAAIHRPRGRASRLAQASRERLKAMRRGRRGKSPGTLPRTTPRQKDAHAASPGRRDGQASVTIAPLLRRPPRAKPGTPTAARAGRSAGGQASASIHKETPRRQRVNLRQERSLSTSAAPPPPCIPALGLTRLRRSDGSPLRGRLCARWE